MIDKFVPDVAAALAGIADGAVILLPGFGNGMPETLVTGLLDQGSKDLTLVVNSGGRETGPTADLLSAGRIRKLICSFVRADSVAGRLFAAGKLELEIVPQGTLAERLRAGGSGVQAFYTPTGADTLLAEGRETRVIDGREYLLEYALKLDYAFIRARSADTAGNLRFHRSQRNFGPVMATAARVTIAEIDEPVGPAGSIDPDDVHTPGIYVHRLVQVPPAPEGLWPVKRQEKLR